MEIVAPSQMSHGDKGLTTRWRKIHPDLCTGAPRKSENSLLQCARARALRLFVAAARVRSSLARVALMGRALGFTEGPGRAGGEEITIVSTGKYKIFHDDHHRINNSTPMSYGSVVYPDLPLPRRQIFPADYETLRHGDIYRPGFIRHPPPSPRTHFPLSPPSAKSLISTYELPRSFATIRYEESFGSEA